MGQVARVRSSDAPSRNNDHIMVADKLVSLYAHGDYLSDRLAMVRQLYFLNGASLRTCVDAIACGRTIGRKDAAYPHQRLNYCKQNKVCPCCSALRHMSRAANLKDQIDFDGRDRLLTGVFTTPAPTDYLSSLDNLLRAVRGKSAVVKALNRWNDRHKAYRSEQVREYGLGLHLKQQPDASAMWTHLHLAIVVGPKVRLTSTHGHGLREYLQESYWHAVDFDCNPKCDLKQAGQLASKKLSMKRRKQMHRAKTVTHGDVQRILAYTFNLHEKEDDAESIALRMRLLADAKVSTTFTRSRCDSLQTPTTQPYMYDPVALGKDHVLVYGLSDDYPSRISPEDWESSLDKIRAEAKHLLTH